MRSVVCAVVTLGLLHAAAGQGRAQEQILTQQRRQYYSREWQQSPGGRFWYLKYFYRASEDDAKYQMHYVIWYPNRRDYYYYYNPKTAKYWCRALSQARPSENIWQVLDQEERDSLLNAIPEFEWNKEMTRPLIPGNKEQFVRMDPPPPLPAELR